MDTTPWTPLRLRAMPTLWICPDRLDDAALDRPIAVTWLPAIDAAAPLAAAA